MKKYIRSDTSEKLTFCHGIESEIVDALKAAGLTEQTLQQVDVYVKPAGSGFRATIQLPNRVSNGGKVSEFFYRRDVDTVVDMLLNDYKIQNLIDNQAELAKPARKKSSTAIAVSEARNSKDPYKLRELSRHNAKSVRKAVESNEYTPEDALIDMLKTDRYVDNRKLLRNIKNLRALFEAFPHDKLLVNNVGRADGSIFDYLSAINRTPDDILYAIMQSSEPDTEEYPSIWCNLASNSNSPDEVFRILYDENDLSIDWRLSLNKNIPEDIARGLIQRYEDDTDPHGSKIGDHCEAILNGENPYLA